MTPATTGHAATGQAATGHAATGHAATVHGHQPAVPGAAPGDPADRTIALLAAHVPITLLLDLADPFGPHSSELMSDEPGSADWLPTA